MAVRKLVTLEAAKKSAKLNVKRQAGDIPTQIREAIAIAPFIKSTMQLLLIGESPLIVNAWNQKARLELLKTHMQQIKIREPKNPFETFLRSMHRMEDGKFGFPVVGVKEAMATAAIDLEGIKKAQIYRNIKVTGKRGYQYAAFADLKTPQELGELFSPNAPSIREDMVRLSGIARTPDVRYRAEFWPWALRFNIGYLREFISSQSIMNLIAHAGFRIGLGEWRQEKGGSSGAFRVATAEEVRMVERWIKAGQTEPEVIDVSKWLASLSVKQRDKEEAEEEEVIA